MIDSTSPQPIIVFDFINGTVTPPVVILQGTSVPPRRETVTDAASGGPPHYTSTACQHRLHDRCRRTCKYCYRPCRCDCHRDDVGADDA